MVRLTDLGVYSYRLGREALKEFFLPIVWAATLIKGNSARNADRISNDSLASSVYQRRSSDSGESKVVNLLLRNAGLIVASFFIVVTVLWYNSQLAEYQREIQELKANAEKLSALADDIFRQIDSVARREGGPSHVSLKGCGRSQLEVQCFFDIDAGARFNIFLERGTRFKDEHGNQYFAANSIRAIGFSDDQGSVSMGPGGVVVEGPARFRIVFRGVRPGVDRISLLEMLAAEEGGFVVYQFRDIPLVRMR